MGGLSIPDWVTAILAVIGYFAVMRWVLPRLGVPT
jgi:hypothetical protein